MECRSRKNLDFLLEKIMEEKGEGIMLRRQGSKYEHGRSPSLIKMKVLDSLMFYIFINIY